MTNAATLRLMPAKAPPAEIKNYFLSAVGLTGAFICFKCFKVNAPISPGCFQFILHPLVSANSRYSSKTRSKNQTKLNEKLKTKAHKPQYFCCIFI